MSHFCVGYCKEGFVGRLKCIVDKFTACYIDDKMTCIRWYCKNFRGTRIGERAPQDTAEGRLRYRDALEEGYFDFGNHLIGDICSYPSGPEGYSKDQIDFNDVRKYLPDVFNDKEDEESFVVSDDDISYMSDSSLEEE